MESSYVSEINPTQGSNSSNAGNLALRQSLSLYYTILGYVLNSYLFSAQKYDLSNGRILARSVIFKSPELPNNFFVKDLFLLFDDNELFDCDTLDIAY
jgi:hypothetical protein